MSDHTWRARATAVPASSTGTWRDRAEPVEDEDRPVITSTGQTLAGDPFVEYDADVMREATGGRLDVPPAARGARRGTMQSLPTIDVVADPTGLTPSTVTTRDDAYDAITETRTPEGEARVQRERAEMRPTVGGLSARDVEQAAGDYMTAGPLAMLASQVPGIGPRVRSAIDAVVSPQTRRDMAQGALQGASSGFSDELMGLASALGRTALGDVLPGQGFTQAYRDARDMSRARLHEAQDRSPGATTLGQIEGAALQAPLFPGGGAAAPTVAGRIGQGALAGIGLGGLDALGATEAEDLPTALRDVSEGIVAGGLTGGIFSGAAEGLGAANRAYRSRAARLATEAIPRAQEAADTARAATVYGTRRAGIGDAMPDLVRELPGGPRQLAEALRRNDAAIESGTVAEVSDATDAALERIGERQSQLFRDMDAGANTPVVGTEGIAATYDRLAAQMRAIPTPETQAAAIEYAQEAELLRQTPQLTFSAAQRVKDVYGKRLRQGFVRSNTGQPRELLDIEREAYGAALDAMDDAIETRLGSEARAAVRQDRRDLQALRVGARRAEEAARRPVQGGPNPSLTAQLAGQAVVPFAAATGSQLAGPFGGLALGEIARRTVGTATDASRALAPVRAATRAERRVADLARTAAGEGTRLQRALEAVTGAVDEGARQTGLRAIIRALTGDDRRR